MKIFAHGADLLRESCETTGDGHKWGRWVLNRRACTLELIDDNQGWLYEVDLETCTGATEILDRILQVASKPFVTAEDIGHLVRWELNRLNKRLQQRNQGQDAIQEGSAWH